MLKDVAISKAAPYFHLTGAEASPSACASCFYLDGFRAQKSIAEIAAAAALLFERFGARIEEVVVTNRPPANPRARSLRWLLQEVKRDEAGFIEALSSLQFYPAKRRTVDDNWRPTVYFAVAFDERVRSAFLAAPGPVDGDRQDALLAALGELGRFCAGYVFEFPQQFSPVAYLWGIEVMPAGRNAARYGEREAKRLEIWRDNTQIGIRHGDERIHYGACKGYVRDVYPAMLLTEEHLARNVGDVTLRDFLSARPGVSVVPHEDKWRVDVPVRDLLALRDLLDRSRITLSGQRLEP